MSAGEKFKFIKDTYIGVLKKYTVINGRARRQEFWIFVLCNSVLSLIPGINFIVYIGAFVPSYTVWVRRLHDTNRSGKWLFLSLIPLVCIPWLVWLTVIGSMFRDLSNTETGLLMLLWIAAIFVPLIPLLVWAAQEGTHGSNDYGSDPKASEYRFTRYHRSLMCDPDTTAFSSIETDKKN